MYQEVNGIWMEVVDLKVMPELPITGLTEHEAMEHSQYIRFVNTAAWVHAYARWEVSFSSLPNALPASGKVARALTAAITDGLITEPGKYGIEIIDGRKYNVYTCG